MRTLPLLDYARQIDPLVRQRCDTRVASGKMSEADAKAMTAASSALMDLLAQATALDNAPIRLTFARIKAHMNFEAGWLAGDVAVALPWQNMPRMVPLLIEANRSDLERIALGSQRALDEMRGATFQGRRVA